jgi:hypothetical protein
LYRTIREVEHAQIIPETQDTTELKNKVSELFHSEIKKPYAIKTKLRQLKIKEPTVSQMNYWLKCLRTEIYGPSQIDLNYLKQWCIERSEIPPEDEDEVFVAGFEVDIDKDWKPYFRQRQFKLQFNQNICRQNQTKKRLLLRSIFKKLLLQFWVWLGSSSFANFHKIQSAFF